jgi:hypothetical protein
MTTYDVFLTIGILVTMVTVYGLYCRQLQIIKKLRSLHPTTILDPDASELPELEKKLREADLRIEASMGRIRNIRGETRETLNSLQEKETPSPTRQQALTALHAITSGANDIREQCQDIETIKAAIMADVRVDPVSVLDRLPDFTDADEDGLCWWWRTDGTGVEGLWEKLQHDTDIKNYNLSDGIYKYTHWLPHWAIVDPESP